jgi:nucleotide-binding universal stress UspA family protein
MGFSEDPEMFKDLMVPVVLGEVSRDAFDVACSLADPQDGHVVGLVNVTVITPMASSINYFPETVYDSIIEAARDASRRLKTQVEACLARHTVSSECRLADAMWLTAPEVAAFHAHYADLVVLGRTPEAEPSAERTVFASLLLDSGRPVLLVPVGAQWPASLDKVVVAWRPSPESSRALHDAMPLLQRSRSVDVVIVEPKVGDMAHAELPGADIGTHLSRHGVHADVVSLPREGATTGAAIERYAAQAGAQLIVAGGYGHSRARERLFGGATRHLFERSKVPVLFSR